MTDFADARTKMVDNQLRTGGITDLRILTIMGHVPRERFVPAERQALSYIDEAHLLPSADGRAHYLGAPVPFARLVQLAEVRDEDKVLDVGCGTGYSAAVLAELAGTVIATESEPSLAAEARTQLGALGLANVTVADAAPEAGANAHGPFDVIVLEGAVNEVPQALLDQLADGGRLVALVRRDAAAAAHIYVRSGNDVAGRPAFNATLPPLATAPRPSEFVF